MARVIPRISGRGSLPAAHAIFFLSGLAGLGYEIVWMRMFALGLGHEMPSLLAVIAAFFGGFALGAWGLDSVVSRSRRPGRWYAGLEIMIGSWALLSAATIPALNRLAAALIGLDPSPWRHGLVALAVPLVGLLPATVAMGATLPAMERLVARLRGTGAAVAGLYAVNTAGAVAGTLLASFVLAPALGFRATLAVLAAVNFCCAAGIALGPALGEARRPRVAHRFEDPPSALRLGSTVFLTGLLGIGYEVLCVRVMSQILENTVYSFASALSVFLLGTAGGAALYQRFSARRRFGGPLAWMLQGLTLSCLLGTVFLGHSAAIYESVRRGLGGGMGGSVLAEMALAGLVLLPSALVMGAVFSHLALAARGQGGGVGRALGLNTLGSSLAPLLFGVILLPALGAKWSLIAAAAAYLLLVPLPEIRLPRLVPTALALPVLAALPANLLLVDAPPGSRIVAYRQGVMAAVAVTEDHSGRRLLKVNNRFFMGGMVHSFADRRQAHIPLLLHPAPRRVLFLGLGSGITAGAATEEPGVQVTGVELLPTVVDFLPWFASANHLDRWRQPGRLVIADARRYIRSAGERFDVIVADLFHPARDGAGALYTQEHFQAVRRRLNEEGLFCQWLPLYQLDLESLQLIVRTFMAVFPAARGYLAHFNVETPMLGLVGRREARRFPPEWYAARVGGDTGLAAALEELALGRDLTLLGCLLAGTADLRALAGEGPLNTDDHPRVTFLAPRFTYSKSAPPYGRLEAMLAACHPSAADLVEGEGPGARAFRARLDRYLAARDEYLRGAMLVAGGARRRGFDAMVEAVRRSPEFRTAYATCLQEVMMRAGSDRAEARHILQGLAEADPGNPRAATLLRRLDAGG